MHILNAPSFFFTNNTGAPHGEWLGRMKPLLNSSCSCVCNSFSSAVAILYGADYAQIVQQLKRSLVAQWKRSRLHEEVKINNQKLKQTLRGKNKNIKKK